MTTTTDSQRLVTHKEMGGLYEYMGQAKPAGAMRKAGFFPVHVYRDVDSGQIYYRSQSDYEMRMVTVKAGAPKASHADSLHWNPADSLPPVDCPLLVLVEGMTVRVERPYFAERKGDQLEYRKPDGTAIFGRFPWTYP